VWDWTDPLGLACKHTLPKYENWKEFRGDFSAAFMTRRNAKSAWNEYQSSPDKFLGRQKNIDILKAKGRIPYTPADRANQAMVKANSAYMWTHGDTLPAKGVQFTTELFKGIFTPQGTPQIYETPAGNIGATIGSAIGNIFG
jgi:hypothetical protein